MSRWFRFYDDALHDPKVQELPGETFKFWVNLLCVASKEGGLLPHKKALMVLLGRRKDHTETYLNDLIKRGLLDEKEGQLSPHNWFNRQWKSDSSSDRVKRFREKKRNVSETPPEYRVQNTEKDSPQTPLNELPLAHPTAAPSACDLKLNGSGAKPTNGTANGAAKAVAEKAIEIEFAAWWLPWPRKQDRGHALKAYRAARKKASAELLLGGAKRARIAYAGTEPRFIPLAATWLNGERWADETAQQTNQDWRTAL